MKPMVHSISEVLRSASEIKNKAERIQFLRANGNNTLFLLLKCAYDPRIKFQLPDGDPPYNAATSNEGQGILYHELPRKITLFLEGGMPSLKQTRRELLFIQFLESLDAADAKLMLAVKSKKLPYKAITPAIVKEAFPDLLP
jgi:hypothetical protein